MSEWPAWADPKLAERGAVFIPAQRTNEYWKLMKAQWLDIDQSRGKHHIFADLLTENGARAIGTSLTVTNGGESRIVIEPKPGEEYGTSFGMYSAGWGYSISPPQPADQIERLGLGTIGDPYVGHHTSYAFVWQWVKSGSPAQPPPPDIPDVDTEYAGTLTMKDGRIYRIIEVNHQ